MSEMVSYAREIKRFFITAQLKKLFDKSSSHTCVLAKQPFSFWFAGFSLRCVCERGERRRKERH